MFIAALVVTLLVAGFIVFIGARFLLAPRVALTGFGLPEGRFQPLAGAKGIRDITSGVMVLVVLAVAGTHALGWALVVAAITPIGDAIVVSRNGGSVSYALRVHGLTALFLVVAGLVLALV